MSSEDLSPPTDLWKLRWRRLAKMSNHKPPWMLWTGQPWLLLLLLVMMAMLVGQGMGQVYDCPRNACECKKIILPNNREAVFLDCKLTWLKERDHREFLSSLQTNYTLFLTITCSEGGLFSSMLWNGMLSQLSQLLMLQFRYCQFGDIPPDAFQGLAALEELTIEGAALTSIHPRFLDHLPHLRLLELVDSRIKYIPSICGARMLRSYNISFNQIASMEHTGVLCEGDEVLSRMEILDVTANRLAYLPANLGRSFPNLTRLSASDQTISRIEPTAFRDLPRLRWLDLTNNSLIHLHSHLLADCAEMRLLGLSLNSFVDLPKGLISGLRNLEHLDFHTVHANDSIWEEIAKLRNLEALYLQGNFLTRVDESALAQLRMLKFLNLSSNQISTLSKTPFREQFDLIDLNLSNNTLRMVPRMSFNSQYSLQRLDLSRNQILAVDPSAFSGLRKLETLDLSQNSLSSIADETFEGLDSLSMLNLSRNALEKLPKFETLTSLTFLYADNNNITAIDPETFKALVNLRTLSLRNNKVKIVPAHAFHKCSNLKIVNLAHNEISELSDTAFDGAGLEYLNLEHNVLEELGFALRSLSIRYLLAQGNRIVNIYRGHLPDTLEIIDLSRNDISYISPFTFKTMTSLKQVDLQMNNLTSLLMISLEVSSKAAPPPDFFLVGNRWRCDCNLGWLKDWSQGNLQDNAVALPDFKGLIMLFCTDIYGRHSQLVKLPRADFLCYYQEKCTKNCPCCQFSHCHCKYVCPPGCQCLIGDETLPTHRVRCEGRNFTSVPAALPTGATELYLDGNNLTSLSRLGFLGLSSMELLFLNDSGLYLVEEGSFIGLKGLRVLHLENNFITSLSMDTFKGVEGLQELYIQRNLITIIEDTTFDRLIHMTILSLARNRLEYPNVGMLRNMSGLNSELRLRLSGNPWTCNTSFVCQFKEFIYSHPRLVPDASEVTCQETPDQSAIRVPLSDISDAVCGHNETQLVNFTVESVKVRDKEVHVLALSAVAAVCVLIIVAFGLLYWQKDFMQIWCFTRFGWRCKSASAGDENRLYDAYVSYSNKDPKEEEFVFRELVPQLEKGEKSYKLCLHDRDFPVGASIAETIVQCLHSSKRVILVLSDSFLDDEWCRFEFETAHQQVLEERRNRLLLVLMDEVNENKLTAPLKLYLKTRTYVRYGDPWFWEKIYYALPDVSSDRVYRPGVGQEAPPKPPRQNGHVNRAHDGGSMEIAERVLGHGEDYEVPVSQSGVYQSLESGGGSTYGTGGSSGHYEEIGPPTPLTGGQRALHVPPVPSMPPVPPPPRDSPVLSMRHVQTSPQLSRAAEVGKGIPGIQSYPPAVSLGCHGTPRAIPSAPPMQASPNPGTHVQYVHGGHPVPLATPSRLSRQGTYPLRAIPPVPPPPAPSSPLLQEKKAMGLGSDDEEEEDEDREDVCRGYVFSDDSCFCGGDLPPPIVPGGFYSSSAIDHGLLHHPMYTYHPGMDDLHYYPGGGNGAMLPHYQPSDFKLPPDMTGTDGRVVMGDGRVGMGDGRVVMGDGRVAMGDGRVVMGDGRVVMGDGRVAMGDGRVVMGDGRVVMGDPHVAMGDGHVAMGDGRVVIGDGRPSRFSSFKGTGDAKAGKSGGKPKKGHVKRSESAGSDVSGRKSGKRAKGDHVTQDGVFFRGGNSSERVDRTDHV